jgi:translation initiation factor RLI1
MAKVNIEKYFAQIKEKRAKINKLQQEIDAIRSRMDSHVKSELNKLTIKYFKCTNEEERLRLEEEIRKLMEVSLDESK